MRGTAPKSPELGSFRRTPLNLALTCRGRYDPTLGRKMRASVAVTVLWVCRKKRTRVQSGCKEGTSMNLEPGGTGDQGLSPEPQHLWRPHLRDACPGYPRLQICAP